MRPHMQAVRRCQTHNVTGNGSTTSTRRGSYTWTGNEVEWLLNVTLECKVNKTQENAVRCRQKNGDQLKNSGFLYTWKQESGVFGKNLHPGRCLSQNFVLKIYFAWGRKAKPHWMSYVEVEEALINHFNLRQSINLDFPELVTPPTGSHDGSQLLTPFKREEVKSPVMSRCANNNRDLPTLQIGLTELTRSSSTDQCLICDWNSAAQRRGE